MSPTSNRDDGLNHIGWQEDQQRHRERLRWESSPAGVMAAVRLQTTVALAVAAFGFVVISAVMLIGNPPAWISAGGFTALTLMLVVTGGYAVVLNRQQPANLRLRRRSRKATTTLVMANIAVQVGIVVVTVADASNLDSWLS